MPEIPGLGLSNPIALTSRLPGSPGDLVAGLAAEGEGRRLLPARLLAELTREPRPELVRLGRFDSLRYRDVRHPRIRGDLAVDVVPTTAGTATIACIGAAALPPASDRRYAAALGGILDRLRAGRALERLDLRGAPTPAGQAAAAGRLAAVYAAAGAALARSTPGPMERPGHRDLAAAVGEARRAYRALALGARTERRAVWARAAARVRRAEAAVDRSARALTGLR